MDTSLNGKTVVVVGGSKGLGRGAVAAFAGRGARVIALGRDERALAALAAEHKVVTVVGDATDDALAERVLREHHPQVLVIAAGAAPVQGAFHELDWDQFQTNWHVDTKLAFVWLRQVMRLPLRDAHVIVVSSGAAINGSPVSGGYASAKRAQWFLTDYAATEIKRAGLPIRVHCLLPNLNASSELGRAGIAAYVKRAGTTEAEFMKRFEPQLTPPAFGAAVADLASAPGKWEQLAYRVGGQGLIALG
jgi:NAD(P)-dependent dehydrogenase (short-subunit alcohol dehydrogenase family)